MKASQLVEALGKVMEKFGDLEIHAATVHEGKKYEGAVEDVLASDCILLVPMEWHENNALDELPTLSVVDGGKLSH
jgi:hypothetical protein